MEANINHLPDELLLFIFKHLGIKDLIQCRLVCKRFMPICDEVDIPELIISSKIENVKDYWFHTHKQFNHKDAINVRTFTKYKSTFRLEKFLKRLHFKGSYSDFDLLNLNDLNQLEQLKINLKIPYFYEFKRIDINLPNVKVLEIGKYDYNEDPRKFYLTLPKLEILKCYSFDSIYVSDPNTIKHLELWFYTESAHVLKHVEYLKFDWDLAPYENILSIYPKLKTLVSSKFDGEEYYDGTIDAMYNFVERKRTLKRPEKIFFQSVELVDRKKVEEYEFAPSILDFQINNYNLLCDNISYDDHLDYNHLMELVNGTLPDNFFKKFFNFKAVKASGKVKNKEHFFWFLKSLAYLKELNVQDSYLDQYFYDCLHEIDQLTKLTLRKRSERGSKTTINYDFLFKLTLLKHFETDYDLPDCLEMIFELYSRLKYFRTIHFYFDKEFIAITKERCTNDKTFEFSRYKDTVDGSREKLFEKRKMDLYELIQLIHAYKNSRSLSKISDIKF